MELVYHPVSAQLQVVEVIGRLDAETCEGLKHAFVDLVARGVRQATVDMAAVTFLDSSGLSALVAGLKTMRQAGGDLNLAAVRPQARTALRLTLLDTVLHVHDTREAAVSALA
jgi:anti-sigma B factor antagonist